MSKVMMPAVMDVVLNLTYIFLAARDVDETGRLASEVLSCS